jgi:hypothetical protein
MIDYNRYQQVAAWYAFPVEIYILITRDPQYLLIT